MMRRRTVDKPFLFVTITLMVVGFFIFLSASLGLLTREGIKLSSVMFNQVFLGLFLGTIAMTITAKVDYRKWRRYAFYIFVFSLILSALVFSPLGFEHGGARRWLSLGPISFQPAEFLKLGFVVYFAAWLASVKRKMGDYRYSILPMVVMLVLVALVLTNQPDTGTLLVIFISAMSMLFVAGAKWKHLGAMGIVSLLGFGALVYFKPYVWQRIMTFLNPASDTLGAGYQIKQSLIAIGSGQFFGRGFGKSIQKFSFLPEPIGDSIFAVTAEEWGFFGCIALIGIFLFFAYRGLYISKHAPDTFGKLLSVGIIALIISQSFINMASMLGIFPLTGMPLLFVSQGGTALAFTLLSVGVVFNISKYKTK